MRVKIGDKVYSAFDEPIMLFLTEEDKENIKNMPSDCDKYCMYPEEFEKGIEEWMENEA
jgi:hypothetical protein